MCSAMSQSRVLIVANDGKKFRVHLSVTRSLSSYTFTHLSPGADRLISTREPPHAPPFHPTKPSALIPYIEGSQAAYARRYFIMCGAYLKFPRRYDNSNPPIPSSLVLTRGQGGITHIHLLGILIPSVAHIRLTGLTVPTSPLPF